MKKGFWRLARKRIKRLAEERGDYHQGVPAITVIVDGGWSKRSHKHSYNAKSGVGIIIGQITGKILHIGVRNKYCSACTQGIPPEKCKCFKNWEVLLVSLCIPYLIKNMPHLFCILARGKRISTIDQAL